MKRVHQRHSGETDRKALRRLDLSLGEFGGAALLDPDPFVEPLGDGSGRDLIAQLANLLPQLAIFRFEAIEPVEYLFELRRRLGESPEGKALNGPSITIISS